MVGDLELTLEHNNVGLDVGEVLSVGSVSLGLGLG